MAIRSRLRAAVLLLGLTAAGCGGEGGGPVEPPPPLPPPPSAGLQHLEQVLQIMQSNSINRLTIDWSAFRAQVLAKAGDAQSIADTYPAIEVALRLLGDGHSIYRPASGGSISVPTRACAAPVYRTPAVPAGIGYVQVGSFSGTAAQADEFANAVQNAIRARDRDDLAGWIVDLRNNGGGNMWPMLAGVGPILGEGLAGHFIDPVGTVTEWGYRFGESWSNTSTIQRVATPYRLRREAPRVAVLTSVRVGSSGEAIVAAFRRRPDTRSFGTATCGLSTANRGYSLPDGATLLLTVSVMADRARTPFGGPIPPDETITEPDQMVQRAVAWLQSGS